MKDTDDEFFLLQSIDLALDYIKQKQYEAACGLWEIFLELQQHPEVGPLLTPEINKKIKELSNKIRKWNAAKVVQIH